MQTLLPPGWAPPIGYAQGIAADAGRLIFVGGQVGWDAQQRFQSEDLVPQFGQALSNVLAVLAVAGATGARGGTPTATIAAGRKAGPSRRPFCFGH